MNTEINMVFKMSKIIDLLDWNELDVDKFIRTDCGEILFELDRIIDKIGYKKTFKLLDLLSLHLNKEDPFDFHNSMLNYDEILRGIEREHMLKQNRKSRKGTRYMSKVRNFAIYYKNTVENPPLYGESPDEIENRAKKELSKTSYWRFKKLIED